MADKKRDGRIVRTGYQHTGKSNNFSVFFKPLFLAVLIILPCLYACTKDVYPPIPPFKLPFTVQKAGTTVETEMRIVEHRVYILSLCFSYKEGDQVDRARVKKLVGDQYKNGDPGIPTPLKLKVSAIEPAGERVIVDKEVLELRLQAWGADFFRKEIDSVRLEPGHYRIRVENLINAPELAEVPITLSIGYDKKSTPISKK